MYGLQQVLTQLFRYEKLLLANAGKDTVFVKTGLEQTIVSGADLGITSAGSFQCSLKKRNFRMRKMLGRATITFTHPHDRGDKWRARSSTCSMEISRQA
jgi:hypothetical protein